MALQQKAAAAKLVAEFVEMLPPASSSLGDDDAEAPWIEEFVSERVLAASARVNMGWAVEQILRAAAARCAHCSVGAYCGSCCCRHRAAAAGAAVAAAAAAAAAALSRTC
jgi:hypothetical protein